MEHNNEFRIAADSAADLTHLDHVPLGVAPLKVITAQKEYPDVPSLDVAAMVEDLKVYKGKSSSSCPNPEEWLAAFGDARYVFAVTLTGGLSGSYNAAQIAAQLYEQAHPDRKVWVVDSLSAGPGERILVEKLRELIMEGHSFEVICEKIQEYQAKTGLLFMLESLTNFANNGRVSQAVAKIAGFMGICIVGTASTEGTLEPTDKCRGQRKSLEAIVKHLHQRGYRGGRIRIAHCFNESGARELEEKILQAFGTADVQIYPTNGLCSFYAEKGGLLVGFDTE